ncbi:acyl carrier protein [Actinoallomurus purpureus]|uniref:acyl carrier protein n=1 Tax=Actinoallomurus purpureus TaxID=478114 RepID=UPI0020932434|nr:acyl carrier protein [Actinoallomurus purpureus]MCO6008426.1 acyl carrier protein [Actinoallomurus purpureus]
MGQFTVTDLVRTMRAAAGEDDSIDLDGDILDLEFDELGYDSLAMMETASAVEREFGVELPEEDTAELTTPRAFVDFVNVRLAAAAR